MPVMDPVSQVDQLVLLLRQRLLERSAARTRHRGGSEARDRARLSAAQRLQQIAALETLGEREVRRGIVQSLLAERLGRELINDANFQQTIDDVVDALERDETGRVVMSEVIVQLRRTAGAD
jgi:hypothetical protein